jgi:hypothetical protein
LRAALGSVALAGVAACGDGTGAPGRSFDVAFDAVGAVGDTLAGRGLGVSVAVRDTANRLRAVTVAVTDAAGTTVDQVTPPHTYASAFYRGWSTVVYVPGPGRYTVVLTATDARGRTETLTTARTVRVDDEAYAVTVLPDRGAGAGVRWIDPRGTVAGWVGTAAGGRRPALWRGGALAEVPTTDSVDAEAVAVNTAGDVLLQLTPYKAVDTYHTARVRTAEGREVVLGPLTFRLPEGRVLPACCSFAADLSESRVAVARGPIFATESPSSVVLDIAAGRADSVPGLYEFWNGAGQALRVTHTGISLYTSMDVAAVGFPLPPFPAVGGPRSGCDAAGRYHRTTPLGLDDDGRVLIDYCGTPALLAPGGASRWVDRAVGGGLRSVHLSRQGGIVAALDTAGTVWLWRAATGRATRVRLPAPSWRLDALGTVNGSGLIAAHGVERATGRRAALLLTPASVGR